MNRETPPKSKICEHNGDEFICENCGKFCCEQCFGKNNCKECEFENPNLLNSNE